MSEYQYLVNMVPPPPIHCSRNGKFGNMVISGNSPYVGNLSEVSVSGLDTLTPDLIVKGNADIDVLSVSMLWLRPSNISYGLSLSNISVSNAPISRTNNNASLLPNSMYLMDMHNLSFNVTAGQHYVMCVMP